MGTFTTKMVWDGTGDGHWDVVFTEMTEGRACVLATIPFDEWDQPRATQKPFEGQPTYSRQT